MRKISPEEVALWLLTFFCFFPSGPIAIFDPPPFVTDKLRVIVIEEPDDRDTYTLGQQDAMLGVDGPLAIRTVVPDFVLWDKDQVPTENHEPWIAEALKKKGDKLPWIIAASPSSGFSKELPDNVIEELKALK